MVDELVRLVGEHEAVAGVGGVVGRDLEELVQPRGAVDGDGLALHAPVSDLGRLQELVELGSYDQYHKTNIISEMSRTLCGRDGNLYYRYKVAIELVMT